MSSDRFDKFLMSTTLIEADHPLIRDTSAMLTKGAVTDIARAERLFYFIRDEITYQFLPTFDERHLHAASILQHKRGYCTQKAILFCSLARSLNIAAGITFYDIIDHSLPVKGLSILKTNILYYHGIATLRLNGRWLRLDATLDKRLCERNDLKIVDFKNNEDCLMHPETKSGARHIEYMKDHGLTDDVSFAEIYGWFRKAYPHLIDLEN
ncbi:transglutaminase domain-containing protein [candidate division KSB1 bacterium]|nr:transglutaminase domain-containing protein [candidate division KSB1 bacterium]